MDIYNEQVVKRDKTSKTLLIKIAAVVLLFLIPAFFILMARFVPYLAMVGFFLFIGGIYIVWWVFSQQKVEYEYSVVNDMLRISKIVTLRKRKAVCQIPIKEFKSMEKGDKNIKNRHFRKVYVAAKNESDTSENTYAVFQNPVYGSCLLVFNPNENIINAMRPHMNQELIKQLFYNNNK